MASKESKRDRIMEAAIEVLSRKGYHNTKMEEIAFAAGIGKGTIYEYFTGKLQLLQEILERSFYLYDHSTKADLSNSLTIEQKIRGLVAGHLRFCQENKNLTWILFFDNEIIDNELRDWAWQKRQQKEEHMQALLAAAISSGEIRNLDTKMLTTVISGIFSSFWIPVIIEGWDIEAKTAAEQVTDIIMHGIKK
jgi:AcrR family transcriptional regulator